jgi:hypothetical protein
VEGYELQVIYGAMQLIKSGQIQAIIIELCNGGSRCGFKDEEICDLLNLHGYFPIEYDFVNKNILPITKKIAALLILSS